MKPPTPQHYRRPLRLIAEIQLTPFIDLTLLLLLVVLVVAPLLNNGRGLGVADLATPTLPVQTLDLTAGADQTLTLADATITEAALVALLKERVSVQPELGVIVRIPPDFPAQRLLRIMDSLRVAGVRQTAVADLPPVPVTTTPSPVGAP